MSVSYPNGNSPSRSFVESFLPRLYALALGLLTTVAIHAAGASAIIATAIGAVVLGLAIDLKWKSIGVAEPQASATVRAAPDRRQYGPRIALVITLVALIAGVVGIASDLSQARADKARAQEEAKSAKEQVALFRTRAEGANREAEIAKANAQQTGEQLKMALEAIRIDDRATQLDKSDPKYSKSLRDLATSFAIFGEARLRSGDSRSALTLYRESLKTLERLSKEDPKNLQTQRDITALLTAKWELVSAVSGSAVSIASPPPPGVRGARLDRGVIVQVDFPSGVASSRPTGEIHVVKTAGPGEMLYVGYNERVVAPGLPGSPIRYSVFLCPTKPGKVEVKVGFVLSDKVILNIPLSFEIEDEET